MTISIDWSNKLVLSTSSINDIVAHHDSIRAFEESETGILYPAIITWKVLDLGGGAYFYGCDYINGYQLKFPNPGNYTVVGNIGATIVPVAGVYVDRTKSAAFATVAGTGGASGPTAEEIAVAVLAELLQVNLPVNVKQVNTVNIAGTGVPPTFDGNGTVTNPGDPWRPA